MVKKIFFTILVILSIFIAGCSQSQNQTTPTLKSEHTEKESIGVTMYSTYILTSEIVGDTNKVISAIPIDKGVHGYELSSKEIMELSKVSTYVLSGIGFENEEEKILSAINTKNNIYLINSTKNIETISFENKNGFEWAGNFELESGAYTWTFSKVDGKYADPQMKMVILKTTSANSDGIEEIEENAKKLLNSENTIKKLNSESLTENNKNAYLLEFEQNNEITSYTVEIKEKGHFVFFTEHMPFEFENGEHFFKNSLKKNIEPTSEEPENLHDHSHEGETHENEEIEHEEEGHLHHHHSGVDPHVWLSIKNQKVMAKNIYKGLIEKYPQNKDIYTENYDALILKLNNLEAKYDAELKNCKKNTILVNHNAYGYLAKDYNFNIVSIAGLEPEAEPTPKKIAELIEIGKEKQIKYIFYEENVNSKVSEVLANEVGAKTLVLYTLETKDENNNYFRVMENNLNNLKLALECMDTTGGNNY